MLKTHDLHKICESCSNLEVNLFVSPRFDKIAIEIIAVVLVEFL